ncbi:MAG TPA: 3-hydroxyacyl-ACP dehydratase FabZ [Burkholderiaceae bacterium]|nr:3-hydroxyacyl-ACP dehydratase FabZ [Burkholderiaceae bacterium]
MMDIHAILAHLPHRFPIILVDRVVELERDKRIVALKNVSMNEPVFSGHFPHYPVMPGVLIIEAMAQAAAILLFVSAGRKPEPDSVYFFAGIDNARFKRPVHPGDQLRLEVNVERSLRGVIKLSGKARVDEQVVCEADMLCTYRKVRANEGE